MEPAAHQHSISESDAVELHRWLAIPRITTLVLTIAFVLFALRNGLVTFDPTHLFAVVLPLFVLACAIITFLVRKRKAVIPLLSAQLVVDALGVTLGVYFTGGIHSPFLGLYILVIISAGIVSITATTGIGLLCTLLFLGIAYVQSSLGPFIQNDQTTIFASLIILALVAFQSQFYARRIREKDEQLIRFKDEFLFRTTHDLRAPSTVIKYVLEKYSTPEIFAQMPQIKEDVLVVQSSAERMIRLIGDLLKIGKNEQEAFLAKKERLDPVKIVNETLSELSIAAQKKKCNH